MKRVVAVVEILLIVGLFFAVAGVATPGINEAHYLVKSKNFWDPSWCSRDLFVASGNPHWLFHATFGALTQWCSLSVSAWIGRSIGWTMLAIGIHAVTRTMTDRSGASLGVAVIWIAGIEYFNLAGEWVIGGIEGKVPAYGLLLFAIAWMVEGKWWRVWPTLGLASGFHVLVGGWSVLAGLVVYWRCGRKQESVALQLLPLCAGGVIAMSGIYPAWALTQGVDQDAVAAAAKIYTFERLSHHLTPAGLETAWYVRHSVLIVIFGCVSWRLRDDERFTVIRWFTVMMVSLAVIGLVLGLLPSVAPELSAKLLRYYWFRMTDSIVPLAVALAWARLAVVDTGARWLTIARGGLLVVSSCLLGLSANKTTQMTVIAEQGQVVSAEGMFTNKENRTRVVSDWVAVCQWVNRTLPQDEILLTPRNQHTFKWYSGRAEVVNWKDVPQDAERLVQWSKTFYDIFPLRLGTVRVTIRYPDLIRYREQYGARFIIVDRRFSGESLPLVQVYPVGPTETNATYAVYRLP